MVLDDARDELRLEQVRPIQLGGFTGGEVEESGVSADPETSATVWKNRADSVAWGLNAQQIVMKSIAVISVDTVEPRSDPDVSVAIFSECANGCSDGHARGICREELSVVTAKETLTPRAEPQIAVAVRECVGGEIRVEAFWFAIWSQGAFAPPAQASRPHTDPQILLIVDKEGTDRVISKAIVR